MVDMVVLSQIATGAFALLAVASTRIAVKYKQEIEQVTKLKDLALYSRQLLATEVASLDIIKYPYG